VLPGNHAFGAFAPVLIYAGEHPVNDDPRPQAKVRKALTPLLEIRNLTKSFVGMPWMTSA
jgi:hypothetical protein